MELFAYVDYVSDEDYRRKQPYELVLSLPDTYDAMFCLVVDRES